MAATDPAAWVRSTPPFDALAPEAFDDAVHALEIVYRPTGTKLARAGGAPLEHLYVIRKGAVRLERRDRTLQVLEEGEVFGYVSLLTGRATVDVAVDEDLVAIRFPASTFATWMKDPRFAKHFAVRAAERLRAGVEQPPLPLVQPDLALEVRQLLTRAPVWIEPGADVGEAARRMREENVSSILVRSDPIGIVTDRDFRDRVLAAGVGAEGQLSQVATRPVLTIPESTPVYEAWRLLLDAAVHHLPITRGEEIVGVVTATDLLRHNAHGPMALLWRVERFPGRDALPGYSVAMADMTAALLAGRLDALAIAAFVARLNDALVQRILDWAEEDFGPAPASYAWIVFGSEGRMEQTLLTDQDNALVYADAGTDRRGWFQRFAERVNADLEMAGFPPCPGGYMGRTWSGPLDEWYARFAGWMNVPEPKALLVASIFFDFRRVGGSLDLQPLHELLATAPSKVTFLRLMAQEVLRFRPPPLLALARGTSTIDLKQSGISPVVGLARVYALERGIRARSTVERLRVTAQAINEDWDAVIEAYRFLLALRLRRQLASRAEGLSPSNEVALADLGAIDRSRLKESLRAIRLWQDAAVHHFQTAM